MKRFLSTNWNRATLNHFFLVVVGMKNCHTPQLQSRGERRTIRVVSGDSCGALTTKCGITPAQFTEYNTYDSKLCSTVRPGQPVCYSSEDLPEIHHKPNGDKCATRYVERDEFCDSIAAANGFTVKELEDFNESKVWGWRGCENLYPDTLICLSKGDPPLPASVERVACGPQKSNSEAIKGGVTIENMARMEPCPLNACCNFRDGVKSANRRKLAANVVNFLNEHGFDGVDMDWEYQAVPDLPDIPAGEPVNGPDYLAFLRQLRVRLKASQSLSIAAPASYWYLKGFPLRRFLRLSATLST